MAKDFLRLFPRPADLLTALRRITAGGLLAAAGFSQATAAPAPGAGPVNPAPGAAVQATTIVDRSRKKPALLLRLPSAAFAGDPQHRSHRSHSSHRSGSSGGSVAAPPPPRKTEPAPAAAPANRLVGEPSPPSPTGTNTASGLLSSTAATFGGVIEAIDRQARTVTIRRVGTPETRVFAYRDDSKLNTVTGSSIRFDEFGEMSGGQIPVAKDDKVQVTWRTSTDGKTSIVTTVTKTP